MTSFYGGFPPDSSQDPENHSKRIRITTDGDGNNFVYITDRHGFEQQLNPKPIVKTLPREADASGLVSILTSDTREVIELPSNEVLRLKKLRKTVRVAAQVIQENLQHNHVRFKAAMVTLTYRDGVEWTAKQVSGYIKCVREWARRKGIVVHYVWVLELTKKGRPHYHVVWWLPKGVSMPKADKQGWWKHGFTKSEWARSPIGYLCKYASKGVDIDSFGRVPKRARLHGHGGLSKSLIMAKTWHLAPIWAKVLVDYADGLRKIGSFWVNVSTGMGISSPYAFNWRDRTLRFKGFGEPMKIEKLPFDTAEEVKYIPLDLYELPARFDSFNYFDAIDKAFDACMG